MLKTFPIKAIIFDLDGVLVFSEHIRFNILQNIFIKRGLDFSGNTIKSFMGRTTKDLLRILVKDVVMAEELLEEYLITKPKNVETLMKPIDVTVNFISQYKGKLPLAIASNSPHSAIEAVIKHLGIKDKFSLVISRDKVTHHKPNPEIYLKTASELQLNPKECMVIEDSIIGAKAATAANAQCYVLLQGYNAKEEFSQINIKGFIETTDDIKNIIN